MELRFKLLLIMFAFSASFLYAVEDEASSNNFLYSVEDEVSSNYEKFLNAAKKHGLKKAEKVLKKWEKSNPKDPELYCSWAQFYYAQGLSQIEQSENMEDFKHTAMFPDTIAMFQNLRIKNYRILKDKGNGLEMYNKAVKWQQRCMDEYPDVLYMYDNYMEILNSKKEYKYSTKVAFQLIDRDLVNGGKWQDFLLNPFPEESQTQVQMMYEGFLMEQIDALMEGAEYELAELLINRLSKAYPENTTYATQKIVLYASVYQMEKASAVADSLMQLYPNDPQVLYVAVQTYDQACDGPKVLDAAAKLKTCDNEEAVRMAEQLEKKWSPTIVMNGKTIDRSWQMRFLELMKNVDNDSSSVAAHLNAWEAAIPDDPDLNMCFAFYYEYLGDNETKSDHADELQKLLGGTATVSVKKWGPDGATCDPFYRNALARLKKTLAVNPDRIDYYSQMLDVAYKLTLEDRLIYQSSIDMLDRSVLPNHRWQKSYNEPIEQSEEVTHQAIDMAFEHLYNMGSFTFLNKLGTHYKKLYPNGTSFDQWEKKMKK